MSVQYARTERETAATDVVGGGVLLDGILLLDKALRLIVP